MRQKTQNHQNQESIEKKWTFWFSPQVTYPLSAKNAREKFSSLGTFNVKASKRKRNKTQGI